MKANIKTIFAALTIMMAAGCTDDDLLTGIEGQEQGEYTYYLNASIMDNPKTRAGISGGISKDELYPRWESGDEIVVKGIENNKEVEFRFKLERYKLKSDGSLTEATEADVDSVHGIFVYKGNKNLPETLTDGKIYPEAIQMKNSRTDHLRKAIISPVEYDKKYFTTDKKIKSEEALKFEVNPFCIVKVVVDGILYPIWGGGQFRLIGLSTDTLHYSLGVKDWTVTGVQDQEKYTTKVPTGGDGPFFSIDSYQAIYNKFGKDAAEEAVKRGDFDKITHYNLKDQKSPLEVFFVVPGGTTLNNGGLVEVKIQTGFSEDVYEWRREFKTTSLEKDKINVLDFRDEYKSYGPWVAMKFGAALMATKPFYIPDAEKGLTEKDYTKLLYWDQNVLGEPQQFKVGNTKVITDSVSLVTTESVWCGYDKNTNTPYPRNICIIEANPPLTPYKTEDKINYYDDVLRIFGETKKIAQLRTL